MFFCNSLPWALQSHHPRGGFLAFVDLASLHGILEISVVRLFRGDRPCCIAIDVVVYSEPPCSPPHSPSSRTSVRKFALSPRRKSSCSSSLLFSPRRDSSCSSSLVVIPRGRLSELVTSQETRDACWLHRDGLSPYPLCSCDPE